jgi:hypothetical protein
VPNVRILVARFVHRLYRHTCLEGAVDIEELLADNGNGGSDGKGDGKVGGDGGGGGDGGSGAGAGSSLMAERRLAEARVCTMLVHFFKSDDRDIAHFVR